MGISLNGLNSGMADTYSTLLGGMGGSDDAGGVSSLLGDYAAIKNGSYGKMMKSYYAKMKKQEAEESGETKQTKAGKVKDNASASAAASLYKSASALTSLNYDDRSEENIGKITDSVSAFVKDYNSLMKNAGKSENSTVQKQAESLYNSYYSNYKLFAKVGITMNSDKTLSFDEDSMKRPSPTRSTQTALPLRRSLAVSALSLTRLSTKQARFTGLPAAETPLPPPRQNTRA